MSHAQSAEMVFVSNRSDPDAQPDLGAVIDRTARLDLAASEPPAGSADERIERLLDRIEQLEFTMAENIVRQDEQPNLAEQETRVLDAIDALSTRLEGLAQGIGDAATKPPEDQPAIAEFAQRLASLEETRAEAADRHAETLLLRLSEIDAALATLSHEASAQQSAVAVDRDASQAALAQLETRLLERLAPLSAALEGLTARVADRIGPLGEKMGGIETRLADHLAEVARAFEKTEAAQVAQIAPLADALSAMQTQLSGEIAPLGDKIGGIDARLSETLEELAQRFDHAQTAQVAQIAPLSEALSSVQSQLSDKIEPLSDKIGGIETRLADQVAELSGAFEKTQATHAAQVAPLTEAITSVQSQLAGKIEPLSDKIGGIETRLADQLAEVFRAFEKADAAHAAHVAPLAETLHAVRAQLTGKIDPLADHLKEVSTQLNATDEAVAKAQAELSERIAALPEPRDYSEKIAALSAQIADLPAPHDTSAELAGLAEHLSQLEGKIIGEARRLADAAEAAANRPLPIPDTRPQREAMARYTVALKTIADRHEAHLSDVIDRLGAVEAALRAVPGDGAIAELGSGLHAGIDAMRQPLVTRMDALAGMLTSLVNDFKLARAEASDFSRVTDPMLSRLDRLDTLADNRQRELMQDIESLVARPIPTLDLTPVRESLARFMVAMQGMQQNRSDAETELLAKFDAIAAQLDAQPSAATPDDVAALAATLTPLQGQLEDLEKGISTLTARPAPSLDLSPVRSALSQQMVAMTTWMKRQDTLQSAISELLESLLARSGDAPDIDAVIETLKTLISASQFTSRKHVETVETRIAEKIATLAEAMGQVAEATTDDALAQKALAAVTEMVGVQNGWQREVVARLEALSVPGAETEDMALSQLRADDLRLIEALMRLREMGNADGNVPPEDAEAVDRQARELRLALAEILASLQAEQSVQI
ncbi:MAG: hypothetical protein AAGF88_09065 [Pseudomonadota bacterium]